MPAIVSSLYSRRGYEEYHKIAEYIAKTVWQRKGNYMVFFPSYKMLEEVYAVYEEEFSVNWGEVYLSEQLYEGTGKRRVSSGI